MFDIDYNYFFSRRSVLIANTILDNHERAINGITISELETSIGPDLLLSKDGVGYAVGKYGKTDDDVEGVGTKEIIETSLHCPKLMKSMFHHASSKCDNNKELMHALRIICYCSFGESLRII